MTTLPERLRASAQSLRASVKTSAPAVLVHPHTFHRIARELEEAAQALEGAAEGQRWRGNGWKGSIMNWMLWSAAVAGLASAVCFAKGAFAIDWSGMVWMFGFFLFGVVAMTLLGCGLLVAQA